MKKNDVYILEERGLLYLNGQDVKEFLQNLITNDIEKGLNEIRRVLKSKGALIILETSVPKNIIVKSLYLFYVRNIIPLISFVLSNNRVAYQYLSDSAIAFP